MGATRHGAPAPPPPIAPLPHTDVTVAMDSGDDGSVGEPGDRGELPGGRAAWGPAEDAPACRRGSSLDEVGEEKAAAKAAAKNEKELRKALKDYMKTSLSR